MCLVATWWNVTQSCCAFHTIGGARNASATAVITQGPGVRSQRRAEGSSARYISTNGGHSSMAYFASTPNPAATPAAGHAHRLRSKIALATKQVDSAQQKNSGGSIVINVPPAANIGTMPPSRNAPRARRSLPNSLRVIQ
jgi:hypothetical protein